jgi:hypothetical protein
MRLKFSSIILRLRQPDTRWQKTSDNEVVFVLPNNSRATLGKPLLETAKLLMACTPNGI